MLLVPPSDRPITSITSLISSPQITGTIDVVKLLENDWRVPGNRSKISNALNLVSEVTPSNGGRLLRLSSVFSVKNNTAHSIQLLAKSSPSRYGNIRSIRGL